MPAWIHDPFTVVDGGLSTALEQLGHHPDGLLWTAQLVIDQPDIVVQAHRRFVDAGAEIIISASYQASVAGFELAGLNASDARRALASTTQLARASGAPFVAASIGPFGASLGDGSEYHGRYAATWDEVRSFHRSRFDVLADTGPDLFAIETIPTATEAEIVLDELSRATSIPAWLSVTCVDDRVTCGGQPIEQLALLAGGAPGVRAFGVNCTDPRHVDQLLRRSSAVTSLPLVAYPNHGRVWDAEHRCWVGDDADPFGDRVRAWVALGARLIGGCCGVGPSEVAGMVAEREGLPGGQR